MTTYCRQLFFVFIVLVIMAIPCKAHAYYQEESYNGYSQSYPSDEEDRQEAWLELKEANPILYHILNFLNPPLLNNVLGNVLSFFIAFGCSYAIFAFEGHARITIILICLYFWCRLISLFVIMGLVGRGILSP